MPEGIRPRMLRSALLTLTLCATASACASAGRSAASVDAAPNTPGSVTADPEVVLATAPPVVTTAGPAQSRRERIRRIIASNVRLEFRDGEELKRTASGVVIASESTVQGSSSWIVTNAHTLGDEGFKEPRLLVAVERDG